ncbi:prolipoprotein diacylglyceryl transferase family protein [Coprobacillaceae bacterium CR2/5/TPMF4]|nr:prolipoprotein diacylglyceryl transferase family protein [Coprobacillaceae bacterium CR2/5/TPMF4]
MITGILGARLWYVIFMWDEIYAQNPLEIIMFRHGGLAIQGGLIAGIAFSLWYFKNIILIIWLLVMQLCLGF